MKKKKRGETQLSENTNTTKPSIKETVCLKRVIKKRRAHRERDAIP